MSKTLIECSHCFFHNTVTVAMVYKGFSLTSRTYFLKLQETLRNVMELCQAPK